MYREAAEIGQKVLEDAYMPSNASFVKNMSKSIERCRKWAVQMKKYEKMQGILPYLKQKNPSAKYMLYDITDIVRSVFCRWDFSIFRDEPFSLPSGVAVLFEHGDQRVSNRNIALRHHDKNMLTSYTRLSNHSAVPRMVYAPRFAGRKMLSPRDMVTRAVGVSTVLSPERHSRWRKQSWATVPLWG